MATKVTLRQKKISKGRKSLYLDFYPSIPHPETGEPTRREFLGLYIFEPIKYNKRKNTKGEIKEIPVFSTDFSINENRKLHNENTLKNAESIRTKRDKQINENSDLTKLEKRLIDRDKKEQAKGEQCFVEYFRKLANKRKASNKDNWVSALNYIETFTNGKLKFSDLNEKFLEDFKEYLLTTKSKKTYNYASL